MIFNRVSGMIRLSCEKSTLGIRANGESSLKLPLLPGGMVVQTGLAMGTLLAWWSKDGDEGAPSHARGRVNMSGPFSPK